MNRIVLLCLICLNGCIHSIHRSPPLPPGLTSLHQAADPQSIIIPTNPPGLSITGIEMIGEDVIISWNGAAGSVAIQSATNLNGTWNTIGQTNASPFVAKKIWPQTFYRLLQIPTPPGLIYSQNFETRIKPAEWNEWNNLNHPATWAYTNPIATMDSIAFGDEPLATGALCTFAGGAALNELWIEFLFRYESASAQVIEVCDLYDTNRQEVCDVYLYPDGLLHLYPMYWSAWCEEPVQLGQDLKILIHYATDGDASTRAEMWWAYVDEEFQNTPLRSCAAEGRYRTPIQKFLWGPVHSGGLYVYGWVRVSTLPPIDFH